jgi:hypothetical protein
LLLLLRMAVAQMMDSRFAAEHVGGREALF